MPLLRRSWQSPASLAGCDSWMEHQLSIVLLPLQFVSVWNELLVSRGLGALDWTWVESRVKISIPNKAMWRLHFMHTYKYVSITLGSIDSDALRIQLSIRYSYSLHGLRMAPI